jgi:hypothetical protein
MTSIKIAVVSVMLTLVGSLCFAQSRGLGVPKSVVPKAGFVPTAKVAVTIAEAVLVPVYGKQQIDSERPFKAELSRGVWDVTGTVACNPPGSICPGGAAEVKISRKTGEILFMTHYQ